MRGKPTAADRMKTIGDDPRYGTRALKAFMDEALGADLDLWVASEVPDDVRGMLREAFRGCRHITTLPRTIEELDPEFQQQLGHPDDRESVVHNLVNMTMVHAGDNSTLLWVWETGTDNDHTMVSRYWPTDLFRAFLWFLIKCNREDREWEAQLMEDALPFIELDATP